MLRGIRVVAVAVMTAAASLVIRADVPQSESAAIQLQLGRQLVDEARYQDAIQAF